jgi:nitrite reductase/ring-hydroxylating ferredoxin subunit
MTPCKPPVLDLTQLDGGPAPGALLADLAGVPADRGRVVKIIHARGRVSVFMHRIAAGEIVAYVNACPHIGVELDLSPGKFLDRTGTRFICSMHGARFDLATGLCTDGPCTGHFLQPVAVSVTGLQIRARALEATSEEAAYTR